jgi:HEPN domain-containing protein
MEKYFMKNPENNQLIREWLLFAKENLLYAKAGLKEEFSPYHTICFLCQGSAEKYLKAYLIGKSWELEKIHDLSKLLDICSNYDRDFQELYPECEQLNEYISQARYPGDLPWESIGEQDAREALEAAEKIEKFVLAKIHLPASSEIDQLDTDS